MSVQIDFRPEYRNPATFEKTTTGDKLRQAFAFLVQTAIPTTWVSCFDSSHWNTFDPQRVTDDFYWLKATESNWFVDNVSMSRALELLERGKRIGLFHFFRANVDGIEQADYFLNKIESIRNQTKGKILIAGDFETTDGVTLTTRQTRAATFLQELDEDFRTPHMYSSAYLWQTMYGNPSWGNRYRGWVAQWANISAPSAIPVGWDRSKLDFWQNGIWDTYAWVRAIPGGQPDIDNDYYMGSLAELDNLIGIEPTPLTLEERVTRLEDQARAHGWDL
jgi:hypothetical protein